MRGGANRRQVVTWGMLAAALGVGLPRGVSAQTEVKADCITVLYEAGEGLHMDIDYDRDTHLPLLKKRLGDAVHRIELRSIDPVPEGAPPSPFLGAANIWIADLEAFAARVQEHGAELRESVANYTNSPPITQFDEVHGMMGAQRDAVEVGDKCLTILYPNGEDVRWDVDYYRTGHMPLIMDLYGEEAIKRFELRRGQYVRQPANPAAYIGSVNIYINDMAAFAAAGQKHTQTLVDDVPNFSGVNPIAVQTTVHGIV